MCVCDKKLRETRIKNSSLCHGSREAISALCPCQVRVIISNLGDKSSVSAQAAAFFLLFFFFPDSDLF